MYRKSYKSNARKFNMSIQEYAILRYIARKHLAERLNK